MDNENEDNWDQNEGKHKFKSEDAEDDNFLKFPLLSDLSLGYVYEGFENKEVAEPEPPFNVMTEYARRDQLNSMNAEQLNALAEYYFDVRESHLSENFQNMYLPVFDFAHFINHLQHPRYAHLDPLFTFLVLTALISRIMEKLVHTFRIPFHHLSYNPQLLRQQASRLIQFLKVIIENMSPQQKAVNFRLIGIVYELRDFYNNLDVNYELVMSDEDYIDDDADDDEVNDDNYEHSLDSL